MTHTGTGVAIVTGADRPAGIAAAIARRLVADGRPLLLTLQSDAPADADAAAGLIDAAGRSGTPAETLRVDLAEHDAPERVLAAAARLGTVTTSGQGLGPMPDELAYAASKAALEALTVSLAPGFAARGVTINAIDPGPTDTGWMDDDARADARAPDGRVGLPEDVVETVAFLLSDGAERLTGQVLRVRGGR